MRVCGARMAAWLRANTLRTGGLTRGGVGGVGGGWQRVQGGASAGKGSSSALVALASAAVGGAVLVSAAEGADCDAQPPARVAMPPLERRGRYGLYKEIGRGGFSVVRLAMDMDTKQLLAAKIFDPKAASLQSIRSEISILRHLGQHQNIVSLHDVLFSDKETIMFTDLVQGGELFDYIVDMGSISEQDASNLLRDVCRGLEYVHSFGICHRDLKPENVLLSNQSPNADVKIADFGLSRHQRFGDQILEAHPNGTIAYWAPEIIKRQPQDHGVDMWAFGVLAYITLTGVHPFDPRGDRSDAEIVTEIASGEYDVSNRWYHALSDDAKDFLARLMHPDPRKRLTATDALAHPWLRGQTSSTDPLPSGHAERLQAYQRLQQLRANILTVIMGVQHAKFEQKQSEIVRAEGSNQVPRTSTVNMDMFREAFLLFDKDESGDIDRDELQLILRSLGQQLSRSEIDAIMQQADIDGDGKISYMEFVTMMNQRLFRRGELTAADLKAAFQIFDSNGDGFISSDELDYMLCLLSNKQLTSAEIHSIIRAADKNGDGKIDFQEFCYIMQARL